MNRCRKDSSKFSFSQSGNMEGLNFKGLGFIVVYFGYFFWGGVVLVGWFVLLFCLFFFFF